MGGFRRARIAKRELIRQRAGRRGGCLSSERAGRLLPRFLPIIVIIGSNRGMRYRRERKGYTFPNRKECNLPTVVKR
jgi:hypothetical protein